MYLRVSKRVVDVERQGCGSWLAVNLRIGDAKTRRHVDGKHNDVARHSRGTLRVVELIRLFRIPKSSQRTSSLPTDPLSKRIGLRVARNAADEDCRVVATLRWKNEIEKNLEVRLS